MKENEGVRSLLFKINSSFCGKKLKGARQIIFYVFGDWDQDEYKKLKKNQPSYEDTFQLLAIHQDIYSEWMLFPGDDLTAEVRRKSDNKEFYLGLAELKAIKKGTKNARLLDDYAVWLVNYR